MSLLLPTLRPSHLLASSCTQRQPHLSMHRYRLLPQHITTESSTSHIISDPMPSFSQYLHWSREPRRTLRTDSAKPDREWEAQKHIGSRPSRRWLIAIFALPITLLSVIGILHIILVVQGSLSFSASNSYWSYQRQLLTCDSSICQSNPTADVTPIPCHSHNDYWRKVPLFNALRAGCTSVEADIWLPQERDSTALRVGHNQGSLDPSRTLQSMYLDPIGTLLDRSTNRCSNSSATNLPCSGVFPTAPNQTLVLLIDLKENGDQLNSLVNQTLQPFREANYLSFHDGQSFHSRPITIVLTGNLPSNATAKPTYRDVFLDAPLDTLSSEPQWTPANSYYASVSYQAGVGNPLTGKLSASQLDTVRKQIRTAKERGLKARYWDTPAWPTSLRNRVWETLVQEGADVLNVDDLESAAFGEWREARHLAFDG